MTPEGVVGLLKRAFFSPDGTRIIAIQEENFTVTLIDVATTRSAGAMGSQE